MGDPRAAASRRAVYLVVLLSVLSSIGHRGSKVLVPLNALQLGASTAMVGVLAALYAVFPLLFAVFAGKISDRCGVRGPILLGALGMTLGLLAPALRDGLPVLLLCPTLIGLGHIFLHVSIHNAVGSLGLPANRARNFSIFSLGASIAAFIGPALAGVAIDTIDYRASYVLLAALSALVALLVVVFPRIVPSRGEQREQHHGERALDLLRSAPLRRTLLMSGVTLTGIELFLLYMPIYGKSVSLSPTWIGVVLSAYAAAAFVVRLLMHRLAAHLTEAGVLTASLFIATTTYALIPAFNSGTALAVLAFALGLGLGSAQPLTIMLTYNHAPQGRSGEALGLRLTVNKITQIAVPLAFGAIGSAFGLAPVFWANAAFLLTGGITSVRDLVARDGTYRAADVHDNSRADEKFR